MWLIIIVGIIAAVIIGGFVALLRYQEYSAAIMCGLCVIVAVGLFASMIIDASIGGFDRQYRIDKAIERIERIDTLYDNVDDAAATHNITKYVDSVHEYRNELNELREMVDQAKRDRANRFAGLSCSDWYNDIQEELNRVFSRELPEFKEEIS